MRVLPRDMDVGEPTASCLEYLELDKERTEMSWVRLLESRILAL